MWPLLALVPVACALLASCGRLGYPADDDRDPPDAALAEACEADEIVCSDFERGLGDWIVRDADPGTRIEIVADPVAVGGSALRIRTDGDGDGDGFAAIERWFAPVDRGILFGRAMVWVGATTVIDGFLVTLQLDDGDDDGGQKLSFNLLPDNDVVLTATTPEPAVRPGAGRAVVRRDTWMCLTFRVDIDGRAGAVTLYEGDRMVTAAYGIDTLPEPDGFRRLLLGAVGPGPATSDVAYDAVTVGRQPQRCP